MNKPVWLDKLEDAVKTSICRSEVLRKLGLTTNGSGNHRIVQRWIVELKIDTSHFDSKKARGINSGKTKRIPLDQVFSTGTRLTFSARKELVNKLGYSCALCANKGTHRDLPLTLQVDHINGNHTDNRIENLRFLCPNCHTQTMTYGSKKIKNNKTKKSESNPNWRSNPRLNSRKVERPSSEDLKKLLETTAVTRIGKMYGVSDNAIRKWAKCYKLI
jgi:5-methylcytosine-specific restriction endonuclease McrA